MSETPSKTQHEPSTNKRSVFVTPELEHNRKENLQKTRKRKRDRKPPQNAQQSSLTNGHVQTQTQRQTLITSYARKNIPPNDRTKCASVTPYRDRSSHNSWCGSAALLFPPVSAKNGSEPLLPTSNQLSTESSKQTEPPNNRKRLLDPENGIQVKNSEILPDDNHARLPNEQDNSNKNIHASEQSSQLGQAESGCSPSAVHSIHSQCESNQFTLQGEQQLNLPARVNIQSGEPTSTLDQSLVDESFHVSEPPAKKICLSEYDNNTNGIKKPAISSKIKGGSCQHIDNSSDQQAGESLTFADVKENIPYEERIQPVPIVSRSPSVSETSKLVNQNSGCKGTSQMILKLQNKGISQSIRASSNKQWSPKANIGAKKVSGKRLKSYKNVAKKSTRPLIHQTTLDGYMANPSSFPSASPLTANACTSANNTTEMTCSNPTQTSTNTPSPTSPVPNHNIVGCSSTGGGNSCGTESHTSANSSEASTVKKKRRRRCGKCSSCSLPDCGECSHCV